MKCQMTIVAVILFAGSAFAAAPWRDAQHAAVLQNDAMRIELQAGVPTKLVDRRNEAVLLSVSPIKFPTALPSSAAASRSISMRAR